MLKAKRGGEWDATFVEFVRTNVRVPDEVVGDIHAMAGACERLAGATTDLLAHYGLADLSELSDSVISRTDGAMRRAIAALPDGVYRSETPVAQMDGSSRTIRCAITVSGETMDIDFAGSSPQGKGSLNSPLLYSQAYALFAVKAMLLPHVSNNDGTGMSITIAIRN